MVKMLIEKEAGSEGATVNLEDLLPEDRSHFEFVVPGNGKEIALRKVVLNKKVVVSRATSTSLSGSVDRMEPSSSRSRSARRLERNRTTTWSS